MMSQAWQEPYVNLFKQFGVGEWTKCSKEGDIAKIMDRSIKSSIFRISGCISSANYIQVPKTKTVPLYLTGNYVYIMFKPLAGKFFSIHLDIATTDDLTIRVSLSNLFKEFKLTSTWLQFPVLSNPPQGSVEEATTNSIDVKDRLGMEPSSTRWTLLCLNMQYVLSVYLNKHFSHMKNIRLCSSMFVKNVFTSNTCYEPGLDIKTARKTGLLASGVVPLPRDLSFPLEKHEEWHLKYDYMKFPNTGKTSQQRNIIPGRAASPSELIRNSRIEDSLKQTKLYPNSINQSSRNQRSTSFSRVALSEKMTPTLSKNKTMLSSSFKVLPEVGLDQPVQDTNSLEIHSVPSKPRSVKTEKSNVRYINCHGEERFNTMSNANTVQIKPQKRTKNKENLQNGKIKTKTSPKKIKNNAKKLQFDPIMRLHKIIGFSGGTDRNVFWSKEGDYVIYTCHSCIIMYNVNTGIQTFLLGHTENINGLHLNTDNNTLVSAQAGSNSVLRIWKINSSRCIAIFQANLQDVNLLSFSKNCGKLSAVGLDINGKQVLSIWDTSQIHNGGNVLLIAKAHTEMYKNTILCVRFTPFDDSRLVSCGNNNVRAWRLRPKYLKSCPVDLGQFSNTRFTDFAFEVSNRLRDDPTDIKILLTAANGNVYEVKYKSLKLSNVYPLLPLGDRKISKKKKEEALCCLNSISLSENFCAVGSADGYLRLWPLSFKTVYLEAEYEGPVSVVVISNDGAKVAGGTITGNLGIVDIVQKSYSTITRSHVLPILHFSFDNIHQQIATVSEDKSIKLWDLEHFHQVYDFQSTTEYPTSVACHPSKAELACGFKTGAVRIFSLVNTSLKYDIQKHLNGTHTVLYGPNGQYLYSAGSDGSLVMHDTRNSYEIIWIATDTVIKECSLPNHVMSIDCKGHRLAIIGPTQYLITVFGTNSLDELLRIDVTCTANTELQYVMDEPTGVCFSPTSIAPPHLLVITAQSRLLKFHAKSGQLLSEVTNIHKGTLTSICCSSKGNYIATAGDQSIKVWDYNMEACQTFIGHSAPITKMEFVSSCDRLISCGEAIYIWDFIPYFNECKKEQTLRPVPVRGQTLKEESRSFDVSITPRVQQPQPQSLEDDLSLMRVSMTQEDERSYDNDESDKENIPEGEFFDEKVDLMMTNQEENEGVEEIDFVIEDEKTFHNKGSHNKSIIVNEKNDIDVSNISPTEEVTSHHAQPNVVAHFRARQRLSELATKRYAAPLNQAGMRLNAVIGCNPTSKQNIAWHPESGLFLYTIGCQLVAEDLGNGKQRLYHNPLEEISTVALQHDGKFVAVGAAFHDITKFGSILIWDLRNGRIHKTLEHHNSSVVCIEYSRDDRFLLSVGDYRECSLVVWSTNDYIPLTQATTDFPIHSIAWHPYSANEFLSVGRNNSVYFWNLVDNGKPSDTTLKVTNGEVPKEVNKWDDEKNDMTSVAYAGKDLLLTATARGVVCVWSMNDQRCFMHWQADNSEIVVLAAGCGKIVTCSSSKNIKLWSLPSMENILTGNKSDYDNNGVVLEDETTLDGAITSIVFDDTMEMGIVGTSNGTIWYVNWTGDTSEFVRIVSGHQEKINDVSVCTGNQKYLATACADGCLKLWNLETREQAAQFLVLKQKCLCVSFCCEYEENDDTKAPLEFNQVVHPVVQPHGEQPSQCIAGYEDGTVRMFDFGQMKMLLKMKPHSSGVTTICTSLDGRVAISGDMEGIIAISSMSTGLTIRVLTDHRGEVLSKISFQKSVSLTSTLWLACSNDCRISIWHSDWSKDVCELNDWLTFASPIFVPEKGRNVALKESEVPCIAEFSPINFDLVLYTGYGLQKEISFYSMGAKKVIRTISIANWVLTMHLSSSSNVLAVGCKDRLVKLIDCESGSFQDYMGHCDSVSNISFSNGGKLLVSTAHAEVLLWDILL